MGYLSFPKLEKDLNDGEGPLGVRFGVCSMQGWRDTQEDAHLTEAPKDSDKQTLLFAVFDGHGGDAVAKYAEQHFGDHLRSLDSNKKGDYQRALVEAFLTFDDLLRQPEVQSELDSLADVKISKEHLEGAPGYACGCTANVALLKDGILYIANAGDSRCVVSKNGKAIKMSDDHTPEDPKERERIRDAGGYVAPNGRIPPRGRGRYGLNLSRSLGDHEYKQDEKLDLADQKVCAMPDVNVLRLDKSHEFMVLACDGIWGVMSNQEVVDFVRKRLDKMPLSKICAEMFEFAVAAHPNDAEGSHDNMTCILVTFPEEISKRSKNGETGAGDNAPA